MKQKCIGAVQATAEAFSRAKPLTKRQAAKDWGEDYWWARGTGGPDRAPNFAKAFGGE